MANVDDAKGRAKEAAGALTNDDDLKSEGQADQKAGHLQEAVETVREKMNDVADSVKDKLKR